MKTRSISIAALATFLFTAVWLALLIWQQATAGPLTTLDEIIPYLVNRDWRYTWTYLNATAVTVAATTLMSLLFQYYKEAYPEWSIIAFVFVPVYCGLNLVVYLSQVTLLPGLIDTLEGAGNDAVLRLLIAQSVQLWPNSGIAFFNGLAYAVLGIPSLIFGLALTSGNRPMKIAGLLLVLNATACLLGIIGYLSGSALLAQGVVIGGVLYFLALIPLSIAFGRPISEATPA